MKLSKLLGYVTVIKSPETIISKEQGRTFTKYVFRVVTSDSEVFEFIHWNKFETLKLKSLVEVSFTINSSVFKAKDKKTDSVYYQLTAQACSIYEVK